jgi:choline kinase
MKAVFLAAGKGSRLGSLTEEMPKSLLKICNGTETLLSFNLNHLYSEGIKKYIFVTGFMHEKLESYISTWAIDKDVDIQYIYNPFWNFCNVLGSFYLCLKEINDDFLYLHADTIVSKNVWSDLLKAKGDYVLTVDLKKCGEEEMKVLLVNNVIKDISKEISTKQASGEFVGVAKFSGNTIPFFLKSAIQIFSDKGLNFYMEATLRSGLKSNEIIVDWIDVSQYSTVEIDFPEDLERANILF